MEEIAEKTGEVGQQYVRGERVCGSRDIAISQKTRSQIDLFEVVVPGASESWQHKSGFA